MKRTLFTTRMLASIVMSFVALMASADEYIDPQTNVVYTYHPGQTNASVKAGYYEVIDRGDGYELEVEYYPGCPDAAGDVVILDRFTVGTVEYVVTSIGEAAFRANRHIKSVSIPETVTDIAASAFSLCDSLRTVQLPEGLTRVAPRLFAGCSQLVSVDIPSSVSIIDSYAFNSCVSLASLTLPAGLTRVGRGAFEGTPWYASLYDEAPEGPFYIGSLLLSYKGNMPTGELVIKEGTTYIGYGAFINCGDLTSVSIPESVTYVDQLAFENCSGLTAVHIKDLAAWCGIEFQWGYTQKSSNPLCYAHHLYLNGEVVTDLVIPKGVTSIGSYAFDSCTDLTSVTIPNGVTNIGTYAFRECSSLTSVTIPPSMATIGEMAFIWCYNLNAVHISDLAAWCSISFVGSANTLFSYGANLYLDDKEVKDLIIPERVTTIGNGVFRSYSRLTTVVIPNSITEIGEYAFANCSDITSVTIGNNVNSIGQWAFSGCQKLMDVFCYAKNAPYTESDAFYNTKIEDVTLHVPAASVSAYQTVEPWKNFKQIVALSTQEGDTDDSDYLPFVEMDKQWNVVSTVANPSSSCHFEKYGISEEVERDGKTYFRVLQSEDNPTVVYDAGLYREENRRVYKYDETAGRDIMLYDFSLKEGDTFTYEMEIDNPVNCKVLKQGWLDDGPFVDTPYNSTDSLYRHRHLRTWTIGRENGSGEYNEIATWVECVGALENMFNPFTTGKRSRLAYIDYSSDKGGKNAYLPFSFCDIYDVHGQVHGSNIPTGAADNVEIEDWHHRLTYELEGDRLHVYGKVFCSCGVDHYAYFSEEETDDPMVRKLHFEIQNANTINALACQAFHSTDFYVPGFDPNFNYIVVDNQREEHPVINKTPQNDYRPFVEEGKVWKVGAVGSGNPVQLVDYYYFDGDTIINGKTCKQMMCQRYVTPDFAESNYISQDPPLCYVGAWYEEDKKVYLCNTTDQQFKFMYDFSVNADDTLQIHNQSYAIGPKQTGGLIGFKGVYRDVRLCAGGTSMYNTTWLEGVGGIDGPTVSVYLGEENHALFLMSCTVGDEVIYLNDEYEDKATPAGARKRFDFSHTIKTKPKARNRSEENLSLYGEYNDQQLGINLNPLDDAYLVSISDETGKVVYEKSVNAGNIVGLNIDISAYAKGHYTVIVENSDETFTGEFDAQATGIRDVRWKKEDGRIIIYNLQGQRLHSLQKGLNIVNGQKVFVK